MTSSLPHPLDSRTPSPHPHCPGGSAPWRVVEHATVGRLHLCTGRGPRGLVVGMRVAEDRVFLHVPEFHETLGYLDGAEVDLEVTGAGPTGAPWAVHVVGPASVVCDTDVPATVAAACESWPPGVHARFVAIQPRRVDSAAGAPPT